MENVRIVTLAPELSNAVEVIEELTKRGITVSLGKKMFLKEQDSFSFVFYLYILNWINNCSIYGCMKLTTHLHLGLRSRMRGAIPPLPQYAFMAWCSVKSTGTTLPLPLLFHLCVFFHNLKHLITKKVGK
jgi:hypothetical protein